MRARHFFLVASFVALVACGGHPTAPSPPPTPAASIIDTGNNQWVNCLPLVNLCTFQAEIRNTGPGCASGVRGTTDFTSSANASLGTFNWTTGGGVMRAGETYVYSIQNVGENVWNVAAHYQTKPTWTNVACQ